MKSEIIHESLILIAINLFMFKDTIQIPLHFCWEGGGGMGNRHTCQTYICLLRNYSLTIC